MPALTISRVGSATPLVTLLLLASCAQTPPAACHLDQVNTLPLVTAGNHLFAAITINGHPATVTVDTGAWRTTLSATAAKRAGVTVFRSENGLNYGAGGSVHVDVGQADQIQLGSEHFSNTAFMVVDARPGLMGTDGLMGVELLEQFDLDVDIAGQRLTMYQPDPQCTRPVAAMDPPLYAVALLPVTRSDHRPRFPVTLNGQDFVGLLDTGAGESIIFKRAGDRLSLPAAPAAPLTIKGMGNKPVSVSGHVLKSLVIGDLEVDNLPVLVTTDDASNIDPNTDMVIGWDLIRRIHF